MRGFLERFHTERLAGDDDFAWIAWLEAIARLGLRDLASLVHSAWDDGRIPEGVIDRSDFENDLLVAEQSPNDIIDSSGPVSAISTMCLKRWNGPATLSILARKICDRPCRNKLGSTSCRA